LDSKPIAAIINATSPRETIAEPIPNELFQPKPAAFAPIAEPINLVKIAKTLRIAIRTIFSVIPTNSAVTPIEVKKTGTNIE